MVWKNMGWGKSGKGERGDYGSVSMLWWLMSWISGVLPARSPFLNGLDY